MRVWITGASSGIGEALAYEYSRLGAELLISARRKSVLEEVRKRCTYPEKVQILPLDLAQRELASQKVTAGISLMGGIDMLINNAGISQRSLVAETEISVDQKLMEINYLGTVALTKAVLPHFIEKKSGCFVTVTSLVGKFGTPYRSSYAASKHALHGFFDTLRAEHHDDNIQVTIICPGFVQTNVSRNALTADGSPQNSMDDATANGIKPEECAKAITKAVKSKKQEVYIGGKETWAVLLKRLLPTVFSKIVRGAKVK